MKIKDYSIIETEFISERIIELKKYILEYQKVKDEVNEDKAFLELACFMEIKAKLKPLTPIVENAYDAGMLDKKLSLSFDNPKGRYFSSLKLDI